MPLSLNCMAYVSAMATPKFSTRLGPVLKARLQAIADDEGLSLAQAPMEGCNAAEPALTDAAPASVQDAAVRHGPASVEVELAMLPGGLGNGGDSTISPKYA